MSLQYCKMMFTEDETSRGCYVRSRLVSDLSSLLLGAQSRIFPSPNQQYHCSGTVTININYRPHGEALYWVEDLQRSSKVVCDWRMTSQTATAAWLYPSDSDAKPTA